MDPPEMHKGKETRNPQKKVEKSAFCSPKDSRNKTKKTESAGGKTDETTGTRFGVLLETSDWTTAKKESALWTIDIILF
jgi:hypothetical protein